nr:MAG TPA: hypothetical protein [Caudoviricetes sp.]
MNDICNLFAHLLYPFCLLFIGVDQPYGCMILQK